jgi:hypothetical protein
MGKAKKAGIIIIALVGIFAGLYALSYNWNNVQYTKQDLINACLKMKQAEQEMKSAIASLLPGDQKDTELASDQLKIQDYNTRCGSLTGSL